MLLEIKYKLHKNTYSIYQHENSNLNVQNQNEYFLFKSWVSNIQNTEKVYANKKSQISLKFKELLKGFAIYKQTMRSYDS